MLLSLVSLRLVPNKNAVRAAIVDRLCVTVLELPAGPGDPPTAVVDPHVIQGVEVSALSAPRCCPPLLSS